MLNDFSCRVFPVISATPLVASSLGDLVTVLHARSDEITTRLPTSFQTQDLHALVSNLAMKYVAAASQGNVYDSTKRVTEALEVCCKANVPAAAVEIMDHIISRRPLDKDYVGNFLMQIVSEIPGVCQPLDVLDIFLSPLKTIFSAWIEKVLGPKPEVDCSALDASILKWDCDCYNCDSLRSSFTALESHVIEKRVSASGYQHLKEKFLNDNKEFLTWTPSSVGSSWTTLRVRYCKTPCTFY